MAGVTRDGTRRTTCPPHTPPRCRASSTSACCTRPSTAGRVHDLYAPCTLGGLLAKGYQYWALGHVHKREVVNASPPVIFPATSRDGMCASPARRRATLITVEDGEVLFGGACRP
ncbi:MAG: hypothetical protein MZV70_65825 [Desulfobacterales bacterium]|nr:hypothetical protein [Desulfobacterales bacterium]